MNYIEVIGIMKRTGVRPRRVSWHEFCFIYPITAEEIQGAFHYGYGDFEGDPKFVDTICLRNEKNELILGWLPSKEDMEAKDWII